MQDDIEEDDEQFYCKLDAIHLEPPSTEEERKHYVRAPLSRMVLSPALQDSKDAPHTVIAEDARKCTVTIINDDLPGEIWMATTDV